MESSKEDYLRSIPSVDELLSIASREGLLDSCPRRVALEALRSILGRKRDEIIDSRAEEGLRAIDISIAGIMGELRAKLLPSGGKSLRRVINATGVVLHTNLGRAVLAKQALDNIALIASGYSNLEFNLDSGSRGDRYSHLQAILKSITGAESALVVNNNAGAVLLCLETLARGKEVVVSRGELIEIGASFRIPDIMRKSGVLLREVGTTNKTRLADYAEAIGPQTALLLKVHPSNYRIVGFTSEVSIEELAALGGKGGIPTMMDLGSGCLVDLRPYGIAQEPTAQATLRAGAGLVTFSGDKLLGGPQAGIILGKGELVARVAKNPLHRALRIDKFTIAALEATLHLYAAGEELAFEEIPTLRMITAPLEGLRKKARRLLRKIEGIEALKARFAIIKDSSAVGGGALPAAELPTFALAIEPIGQAVDSLEARFRLHDPPVLGRIQKDRLLFDMRTVADEELEIIARACRAVLS